MPIETLSRRQSALIENCGMVTPDASISESDRASMVGQYGFVVTVFGSSQDLTLYFETAREAVTPNTYGMTLEPSRALNLYVEQSRAVDLDLT
jgi:hypothetical protein